MMELHILPKGWTVAKLGDLVITEKGKKPKRVSKDKTKEYSIPYVNIKAFEKNIIEEYTDGVGCVICEDDDLLMVWDGSRSGYVGKAIRGALGSTLVRIKLPFVNQDLTYYFLKSKFVEINSRAKGVGIPHVDSNLLWNYDLPLAPLNEQKRILAKLEQLLTDLEKGIEYLETTQQQLNVYMQSLLKWAFEGREKTTVGELFDFIGGGTPSKKNLNYWKGKIPWASVKDIKGDYLYKTQDRISVDGLRNSAANLAKPNDVILITRISPGKPIITKVETAINQDLKILKPKFETTPKFVFYVFKSIELDCIKKSSGTTVLGINLTKLKEISIPKMDKEEQRIVVYELESKLAVCEKIEETIASSLQQAEALRSSILKKAFEGKLVPQDPNDEPAEKLLESIRALRQAQGKQGKGKPEKKEKANVKKKTTKN